MANWSLLQEQLVGLPVAKRAKHGIHFQKGANEFVANFSGAPCHYQDGGIWKPIDTKLILLPDGFYGCPHSPVRVHSDGRVKVVGKGYAQRTELPSASVGLADNDKLVREFSFGKQEMRITEDGFKSEITLNRTPTLAEARKLIASESGTLSKEYLKSLTTATDASGDVHTYSTLSAFRTWLASAAFPVIIDPDFASSTGYGYVYGYDNDFATAKATSSAQYTNAIQVGSYGANKRLCRGFIKFDTSSIDDGVTVTQVNLKGAIKQNISIAVDIRIKKHDWSGSDPLSAVNREAAFDGCLSADADDSIWISLVSKTKDTVYTSGNLSTTWVSKTGMTYYALVGSNDESGSAWGGGWDYVDVYEPNAATESYRPVLTVTYTASGIAIPVAQYYYNRLRRN